MTEEELKDEAKKICDTCGVSPRLKGYNYMVDMIIEMKKNYKYSRAKINDLVPFIAKKYGIQESSVQRQLRYSCTIQNVFGIKMTPAEVLQKAFRKINYRKE